MGYHTAQFDGRQPAPAALFSAHRLRRSYGRAAYRLAPMNAGVCDAYAVALAEAGDLAGARQLAAKAVVLAPGDPVIATHARRIAA